MPQIKVITVGSAVEDTFVLVSESRVLPGEGSTCEKLLAFELGEKIPVGRIQNLAGGAGLNVAVGLSKLGIKCASCVALGGDEIGKRIKREIVDSGIKSSLVQIIPSKETDRSIILVEPIIRDRTIFYNRQAGKNLKLKGIAKWEPDWVFVSSLDEEWENKLGQILRLRKKKAVKIAFNPGRKQLQAGVKILKPFLEEVSILFLNWDEALELSLSDRDFFHENAKSKPTPIKVLRFLHKLGPQNIALTLGKKGSIASDGYNVFRAPALSPKRVEVTGAGDAFASAFLGSWILDEGNMKLALGWGRANAGNTILYFGAQKGLLDLKSIKRQCNEILLDAVIKESRL